MSDDKTMSIDIQSFACPTEEDIRRWEALPRSEQLRRLQMLFDSPECSAESSLTMDDILAQARNKVGVRQASDG